MMKKFSLMFATAAIVAGGMLTASCSDSDNESSKSVVVKEIVFDQKRTVKLTANVDTKFTIGNVSKTGKVVEFEVNGNTATIKAEVEGYVPQEATIDFSKNQGAAAIQFEMIKESTNLVAQEDAKGNSVTNDAANQQATGVASAIEVPADVVITGNTTDPFSITAFVPAPEVVDIDDVKPNVELSAPVLGFECDPDGAQFDKPVTISAILPGSEGFDIVLPGAKNVVREGDKISFTKDHFSNQLLQFPIKIVSIKGGAKQIYNATLKATDGSLDVTYKENAGFEGALSGYWYDIAVSLFGSPLQQVEKTITVNYEGQGSVNVVIEQAYSDVTVVCGSKTTTVRYWGEITATATGMADQGHSAGSANGN